MKTTFVIDLLRPGQIAHGRYEWFVGPGAPRRLLKVFAVGATVLALVLAGGLAPRYWRHSADLRRIAKLKQEIATTTADMAALRGQLASMSAEARRQVRWTELLATLSREAPAALKLHRVSLRRAVAKPQPQAQQQLPASPEVTLQIEAVTPQIAGSPPLLEIASFMAGVMRDPAVSRRFQLERWEIKPQAEQAQEGPPLLHVEITLSERRS